MIQEKLSGYTKGGSVSGMQILLAAMIRPPLEHCITLAKHL